jgi:hypothetical protein
MAMAGMSKGAAGRTSRRASGEDVACEGVTAHALNKGTASGSAAPASSRLRRDGEWGAKLVSCRFYPPLIVGQQSNFDQCLDETINGLIRCCPSVHRLPEAKFCGMIAYNIDKETP